MGDLIRRLGPLTLGGLAAAFSVEAWGLDPGCSGILRQVFPLGSEQPVAAVEAIAQERAAELLAYTHGKPVLDQLKAGNTFGFVAILDESIAGFAVYRRGSHSLTVSSIAVSQQLQGRGVGRDLIARITEEAHRISGVDEIRALVLASDLQAIAFFEHLGFKTAETIPRSFQGQTEAGVLLKKSLQRGKDSTPLVPQRQPAPQHAARRATVATRVIDASPEFLREIDPTLDSLR